MSRDKSRRSGQGTGAATRSQAATNRTVPLIPRSAAFGLSSLQCPDCGARPVGIQLTHAATCPLARGVDEACDNDRDWFEAHPDESVHRRPVTPAEVADAVAVGLARPVGTVTVFQLAPRLRSRLFEYADGAR